MPRKRAVTHKNREGSSRETGKAPATLVETQLITEDRYF
jgi:hypothetical protein